ncbi:transcriptional regulator [Aliidongia dinghuensis]|uniref:Transcriptional regulator n=1 Tax=Aliidongia dinghuensis TaxID=1867774 RepID=A0A8J2YQL9_9PROT|nr:cupin domain-containing protein [Aliidongia dinghuensis]GGF05520.1 transcriptional regulator [Aliidongia dinghuensis]
MDWLSRLLELVPVRGRLDLRCFYGAPWRIEQGPGAPGEIPYHAVLGGSAVLEDPAGGRPRRLTAGDILLLPRNPRHVLHDGGGGPPMPAEARVRLNVTFSENAGTGDRLDMLCGHFMLSPPHDRLVSDHLPPQLVVRAADHSAATAPPGAGAQLAGLVSLLRIESAIESLGSRAMLNALSTAMFALTLRLASEADTAPTGLLALAGHPRLAPALTALFQNPGHPWSLPELARLCHMSRATFARHFQESLGRSAAELLTDIRMTLAANLLRHGTTAVGAVADAAGYQSEAAFQRAFKQHMGVTPAQWRRSAPAADGEL